MNKQSLTIIPLAVDILRKEKRPLHYKEITKRLLAHHQLHGQTPQETVRARLGTDARFKRVAEGVYALAEWDEFPVARFAKDIAYDVLKARRRPMSPTDLGKAILEERHFVGNVRAIVRNSTRSDSRFYYAADTDLIGLVEWKAKK